MEIRLKDENTVSVQMQEGEVEDLVEMMRSLPALNPPAEALLQVVTNAIGRTEYAEGAVSPGPMAGGYYVGDMTMEEVRALLLVAGIKTATIASAGAALTVFLNFMFNTRSGLDSEAPTATGERPVRPAEYDKYIQDGVWPVIHRVPGSTLTTEALDAAERGAFANINIIRRDWTDMGISFPQVEAAIDARDINQLAAVIIACRTGGDQVDGPTRDKAAIMSRSLTDIAIEVNNIWEVNRRRAELSNV